MKRDIGKIIASGSAKKRAQLMAEVTAQQLLTGRLIISEEEFRSLEMSFKNTQELRVYSRYRQLGQLIPEAINVYQGAYLDAMQKAERLSKLLLYWHGLEEAEKLVNMALLEAAPELEQRQRITEKLVKAQGFWFCQAGIGTDGLLQIDYETWGDDRNGIKRAAESVRESLLEVVTRVASWRKAILDVIAEEDFPVKAYVDVINNQAEALGEKIRFWGRYGEGQQLRLVRKPRKAQLLRKLYRYEIDLESLEISQADYDYFRDIFLTGKLDEKR
jgi:hypothetical protein